MSRRWSYLIAVALLSAGCSQQPPGATPAIPGDQNAGASRGQEADWARITQLETEAKSIVRADGCNSDSECSSAPVGSRACGGPRYYLVYCVKTTDTAALRRKLEEVTTAERAYNAKYQLVSTCEFRMPPAVGIVANACQAP